MNAACILVLPVLFALAAPDVDSAPRISLSASEWNFGEVWEGDRVRKSFTIRNDGDAPLRIKTIRTSCTCTTAELRTDRLLPGESVDVTILLHTKKRQGSIATTVVIESNDPQAGSTKFEVRGTVKKLFEYKNLDPDPAGGSTSPTPGGPRVFSRIGGGSDFAARKTGSVGHAIALGRVCVTEARTRRLEIVNQFDQTAKLEVASAPRHLDVELLTRQEGRVYELRVATRPPMKPGPMSDVLVIHTGFEKNPDIEVLIAGEALEPISASPAAIRVPARITKPISRPVTVTYNAAEPFNIGLMRVVGCDNAVAEVVSPVSQPAVASDGFVDVVIQVLFSAGAEIRKDGAALEIETGDPKRPRLSIPIRVAGRQAAALDKPALTPSGEATTQPGASAAP